MALGKRTPCPHMCMSNLWKFFLFVLQKLWLIRIQIHSQVCHMNLTCLNFKDNMNLFYKADKPSFSVILEGVNCLLTISRLRPSPSKSSCYFCSTPTEVIHFAACFYFLKSSSSFYVPGPVWEAKCERLHISGTKKLQSAWIAGRAFFLTSLVDCSFQGPLTFKYRGTCNAYLFLPG